MDPIAKISAISRTQIVSGLDRLIRLLIIISVSLAPLVTWQAIYDYSALPKAILLYATAVLLFALFAFRSIAAKRLIIYRTPLDIPLLLLLAAFVVGAAFSTTPILSFIGLYGRYQSIPLYSALIAIYWFSAVFFKKEEDTSKLFWSLSLSLFLVSIVSLLQYSGLISLGHFTIKQTRIGATLGNPVFLADFVALIIPIVLNFYLDVKGPLRIKHAYLLSTMILALTALMLSQSRGGFVAAIAGVAILMVLRRDRIAKGLKLLALLLVAALLMISMASMISDSKGPSLISQLKERLTSTSDLESGTVAARLELWRMSTRMIKDSPIYGHGLGQSIYVFPKYRTLKDMQLVGEVDLPDQAHNEFLQILLDAGLLGGTSALSLFILLIGALRKITAKKAYLLYGAIASLGAYFFKSLTSIGILENLAIAAVLMGVLMAAVINRERKTIVGLKFNNGVIAAALILVLIICAIMLYPAKRVFAADRAYRDGVYAYKIEGNSQIMFFEKADLAIALNPFQAFYRYDTCRIIQEFARDTQDRSYLGKAVDLANGGLRVNPMDSYFNLIIGQSLSLISQTSRDSGQIDQAINTLKARTSAYPLHSAAHRELMRIYLRTGDTALASQEAKAILLTLPNDKEAKGVLAQPK